MLEDRIENEAFLAKSMTVAMAADARRAFRVRSFLLLRPVIDRYLKKPAPSHAHEQSVLSWECDATQASCCRVLS